MRFTTPNRPAWAARRIYRWSLGLALMCWASTAIPLEAGQVRPVNLEEMTGRADRIFTGRCLNVTTLSRPDVGPVTRVMFRVDRALKGELGATLTIEMIGSGRERGARPPATLDVPQFVPGERVMVFLYGDSALGLTSPVALGQGKFTVRRDKDGNDVAANALHNSNLMRGMSTAAHEQVAATLLPWADRPELPLQALLDGVKALREMEGRRPPRPAQTPPGKGGQR